MVTNIFMSTSIFSDSERASIGADRKFHFWLHQHKTFGPILDNWHQHRAITSKVKTRGALCMIASFCFSIWIVSQVWLKVVLLVMLMTLLTWFIRLPVIDRLADKQENH